MAEKASIRLNKVLRELNISLDRAVEHLSSKDIQIEARPTTKISNETYQSLLDEFETDKSKKDESAEITEEKRKEKEQQRLAQEQKEKERLELEIKNKEIIKAKKIELEKPKTVGKIDLKVQKVKESFNPTSLSSKNKPYKSSIKEPVAKDTSKLGINKESKVKEKVLKQEKPLSDIDKKNDKDKTNEEVVPSKKIETQYQKLSGPKKTGQTINLDKVNQKEKNVEDARKKKRKRISKEAPSKPNKNQTSSSGKRFQKNNRQPQVSKVEPTEEEVQKQIRETLAKLQGKSNKSKGAKYRRDKRSQHREKSEDEIAQLEAESKTIKVTEFITVGDVATLMEISSTDIISACMSLGIMVTMNQRLDAETLSIVADEFGYKVEFVKTDLEENIEEEEEELEENLSPRAPIVTVMGHVDHGKTSLLDYIREENVIAGESGGITQHIGAYSVDLKEGQKITFLDTPGHEAFTAMRARGAQVTDIAVIVIAADDDIMPQTKEAISHAQAASVPIVFAINKVDKENSNPEKIKEALAGMNLMVEDWGGKVQSQDVSALKGTGVPELLEKVLLEAELLELKANKNRRAKGAVVEAFLDKGRGYVSTVLIQNGTLNIGDYILAGKQSGKVKAMFNERGSDLTIALP